MAMVRFEDVATRVNTREDRFNTALTYYVGGEHIETGELKVSGRGVIKEADLGPMFYFGFKAGDILFVTRNPHLRKCGMVDFPGICSEKTLVIATKDESVLSQKYLAAVMQSDDFWEFMEENKSGSVNYFVNWSTLAEYEFDLPPIDRQRELADLLWEANDLKEAYKKAISATDEMLEAKFRELFGDAIKTQAISESDCIQNHCQLLGGFPFDSTFFNDQGKGLPLIRIRDVNRGWTETYTTETIDEKYLVNNGDLLVGMDGDFRIIEWQSGLSWLNQRICRIRSEKIAHKVLKFWMQPVLEFLQGQIAGTIVKHLSMTDIANIKMPCPSLYLQRQFVKIAEAAEAAQTSLKNSIVDLEQVMKGLING